MLGVDRGLEVGGVEVQVVGAGDVAEDRRRPRVPDRVRRGDEVERREDDLVARAAARGEQREVQRRGAVGDRERVLRARRTRRTPPRTPRPSGPCSTSPSRRPRPRPNAARRRRERRPGARPILRWKLLVSSLSDTSTASGNRSEPVRTYSGGKLKASRRVRVAVRQKLNRNFTIHPCGIRRGCGITKERFE